MYKMVLSFGSQKEDPVINHYLKLNKTIWVSKPKIITFILQILPDHMIIVAVPFSA